MKKIAIAIPTYNRERLLSKLIQTIPSNIVISISDNGSFLPDHFAKEYKNVSIIKHQNVLNMFDNWNAAIKNINEIDFIAITSDDDLYDINSFEFIQKTMNTHDADVFIFGNNFIDENDHIIGKYCPKKYKFYHAPNGLNEFLYGVKVRMPSVFFKKSFLDKIGYFDEKLFNLTAADSELIQRALLFGKVAFIPKIVGSYRVWSGSLTAQKIASQRWMKEVEEWTNKIMKLATDSNLKFKNKMNWEKYKDEIFARNLLSGLNNLYKSKKYKEVLTYYSQNRFPHKAFLKTKTKIFQKIICSKLQA